MNNFVTLKSLCLKITDGSHYSPKGENEGYPMLSVKDMTDFGFTYNDCKFVSKEDYEKLVKADCKPKLNDLLIAKDGSYLKHVFVIKEEIDQAILSSIGILRPNLNKVYPDYLKYYLQTKSVKETVSKKYVSGSALPRIILKGFEQIEVLIKDLPTQKSIAKVLSDLDAKIELNNRINRELEAMAKTLYDYWFVQFDFPDANGKPYKSSGGKMVYNAELKREIPEGWEVKIINNFIEVKDGTHDSPKPKERGFHLITSKNLLESGLDFENANLISEEDYININKRSKVETGDILFSMIGSIGVVYKVEESNIRFAVKNVALYKTSQKQEYKNFIYQYLKSYDMQRYMGTVISGSIQKFIGLGSLRNMPLLFNKATLKTYISKTNPIYLKLNNIKKQNQQLSELRDWLLPMLMNGQVTVSEL